MMLDAILHAVGYGLCHQLPERTLVSGGHLLPVCARDTGIYLGFVASFITALVLDRGRRSAGGVGTLAIVFAGIGFLAMAFDGFTSYAGLRATTNFIRLLTGVGAGAALGLVTLPVLAGQLWREPSRTKVLDTATDAATWLALMGVTVAAAWFVLPMTGEFYPLLVVMAILATFTAVNAVLVAAMSPLGRCEYGLGQVAACIGAGAALACADLVVAAVVKGWLIAIITVSA